MLPVPESNPVFQMQHKGLDTKPHSSSYPIIIVVIITTHKSSPGKIIARMNGIGDNQANFL
jgi:hypothetical protein